LTDTVARVLAALGRPVPDWPRWEGPPATGKAGFIRGLYCGGSLCDEAMAIVSGTGAPVRSNIPLRPEWRIAPSAKSEGHTMIDFGDDELTVGRPHPMIDGGLRLERLATEAADPSCAVILLDVVLGYGSDPDPAVSLAPAVATARQHGTEVVVALVGTLGDPQDRDGQAVRLSKAGAHVFASNAAATRFALGLVT
jgi:FdrA protein